SGLRKWLAGEVVKHDLSHVRPLSAFKLPAKAEELGACLAGELRRGKAIMGVFDEGCMGMYNAIIPDELLHATGVFKERLSQSALFAGMGRVSDAEALAVRQWLERKGLRFLTGRSPETDLTDDQILGQCKMYIAALGFDPETTLHDLRYGEAYGGDFVWVFEISGAVPPHHFIGGYAGAVSERQPPMYFRLGGGTLKGISKPGDVVWSRVFVDGGK